MKQSCSYHRLLTEAEADAVPLVFHAPVPRDIVGGRAGTSFPLVVSHLRRSPPCRAGLRGAPPGGPNEPATGMAEAEWLAEWRSATDPMALVDQWAPGDRQLRLFACACVRRAWPLLADGRSRRAVEVSEAFADGGTNGLGLLDAREESAAARASFWERSRQAGEEYELHLLDDAADNDGPDLRAEDGYHAYGAWMANQDAARAAEVAVLVVEYPLYPRLNTLLWQLREVARLSRGAGAWEAESKAQADLVREVAGNPFRRGVLNPDWLGWEDRIAWRLAQTIYDERAFDRLPILADALEEAGCTDRDILTHFRGSRAHVRGCWALDWILGAS